MTDPFTVATTTAGLALGGASLAVQIFDGALKGFAYFETAVRADSECEAFKLRLRLQYARLYDWGDLTGLIEKNLHNEYNRKMKHSQANIVAILSELKVTLKELRDLGLSYEGLTIDEESQNASYPDNHARTTMVVASSEGTASWANGSGSSSNLTVDTRSSQEAQDLYQGLFAISSEPRSPRKHRRGINHILDLAHGARKVAKQPKRFRWAFRDKKRFSELLPNVTTLIDYLHETLSDDQMRVLLESSQETQLAMTTLSNDVQEMKSLLLALRSNFPGSTSSIRSYSSSGTTLVEGQSIHDRASGRDVKYSESRFKDLLERVLEFKILKTSIRREDKELAKLTPRHVALLKPESTVDDGLRTFATLGAKQSVWVEWKYYTGILPPDPEQSERVPDDRTVRRVQELAALLKVNERPKEFSVPPCLGYYEERNNQRFGFVFQRPEGYDERMMVRSLSSLFAQNPVGIRHRIATALQLSKCLVYFHAVDWLHKGLRSASVLVFTDRNPRSLGQAYISGFEYSRPVQQGAPTSGPSASLDGAFYVHPEYLSLSNPPKFRKTYDMYSLGIILIELALWRKIDDILGFATSELSPTIASGADGQASAGASRTPQPADSSKKPSRKSRDDIIKIRPRILDPKGGILDQVEDAMGFRYTRAVRACIEGPSAFDIPEDKDQSDPVIGMLLQQEFIRVVIDALAGVSI